MDLHFFPITTLKSLSQYNVVQQIINSGLKITCCQILQGQSSKTYFEGMPPELDRQNAVWRLVA